MRSVARFSLVLTDIFLLARAYHLAECISWGLP
jgi:hypothetical protein